MNPASRIQIDFGHRTVTTTAGIIRAALDGTDVPAYLRAIRFKDTPEARTAALGIARDIAAQMPGLTPFPCVCCGAQTFGPDDTIGPEVCGPCYELAGLDNMCNDEGREPDEDELAEIAAHLRAITAAGGDAERALSTCDYLQ